MILRKWKGLKGKPDREGWGTELECRMSNSEQRMESKARFLRFSPFDILNSPSVPHPLLRKEWGSRASRDATVRERAHLRPALERAACHL